jgi:hypothetical protein
MIKFFSILFFLALPWSANASNSCQSVFVSKQFVESQLAEFSTLSLNDRLRTLDQALRTAKTQLRSEPRFINRLLSGKARELHSVNQKIQTQINELSKKREIYQALVPLLKENGRDVFLSREDEVQLLNRVLTSEKLADTLKFLSLRRIDTNAAQEVEIQFIHSIVRYVTWGPEQTHFPAPFYHWLILDMMTGANNPNYLIELTHTLNSTANVYKNEKVSLNEADSAVTDYWLRQSDPVFDMIEKTNSDQLEKIIEKAVDDNLLLYHKQYQVLQIAPGAL